MVHYKLTYFNIHGLGEGPRLLFKYAGIDFEDCRITDKEWELLKPKTPFGHVPVLEIDGRLIAESGSICRYLARTFGLVPPDLIDEAIVDSIFEANKDFNNNANPYLLVQFGYLKSDKDKNTLMQEYALPARDKYFPYLQVFLKNSKGDFLLGDKPYWADIVIADQLDIYLAYIPPLFDGYPDVKKFVHAVNNIPNIKKWRSERPKAAY